MNIPVSFYIFLVLAVIVFFGLLAAAKQNAAANRATSQEFETSGITVEGHLLSKQVEQHEVNNPGGRGTNSTKRILVYSLTYTYGVNGQLYEHVVTVDKEHYERFHKGDSLRVRYLPDTPDISRVIFDS